MTDLRYDDGGFIIGMNSVKDGIDNVYGDTHEIIQILKSQNQIANTRMNELARAIRQNTHESGRQRATNNNRARQRDTGAPRISRSSSTQNRINSNHPPIRRARITDSANNNSLTAENGRSNAGQQGESREGRTRDANGRFTSGSSSAMDRLASSISRNLSGQAANTSGVDPVLDSIREAKELLSPIGRAGKLVGRGAKFSISKLRSLKRREPLPQDQDRHNNENEKLLDKIWKAIKKSGGGSGGGLGLVGGLLGGLKKGGGLFSKILKSPLVKKIAKSPLAIAAIAAGTTAMNWGTSTDKEKAEGVGGTGGALAGGLAGASVGAAAGSVVVPVIGTAIGGVIGGALGAWLGHDAGKTIGGAISPHIEGWTSTLNRFDLPRKMMFGFLGGLNPLFTGAGSIWDWVKQKAGSMFGFGGGAGGDGTYNPNAELDNGVTQKASKAADLITERALTESSGYCARFVRKGLQDAGYDLKTQQHAYQYGNGALTDAGFTSIDPSSAPKKGDVMVMPQTQGKNKNHSSGHIQTYNGTQWVSDFKQNGKNPWNDVADKDLKYQLYRDTRGSASAPQNAKNRPKTTQAVKYFMKQGWTKEQAVGLAANIEQESQFDHTAKGDKENGVYQAYGLAQWRGSRQTDFKNLYGKKIQDSTFEEQLAFMQHELTKGKEKSAGDRLKKTTSARAAAGAVSEFYERPSDTSGEKIKRGKIADSLDKSYSVSAAPPKAPPTTTEKAKVNNSVLGVQIGKITASNNLMPASKSYGAAPTGLPAIPRIAIPNAPKMVDRLDSGGNKPIILQASNDTINQNVSDRGLAHAITGGLGQDRYWG